MPSLERLSRPFLISPVSPTRGTSSDDTTPILHLNDSLSITRIICIVFETQYEYDMRTSPDGLMARYRCTVPDLIHASSCGMHQRCVVD